MVQYKCVNELLSYWNFSAVVAKAVASNPTVWMSCLDLLYVWISWPICFLILQDLDYEDVLPEEEGGYDQSEDVEMSHDALIVSDTPNSTSAAVSVVKVTVLCTHSAGGDQFHQMQKKTKILMSDSDCHF